MPMLQTQTNVTSPVAALPFSKSRASVTLDAVRGIAALLVFTDHWRHAFFLELRDLPSHPLLLTLLYIFTACGHAAVVVFFVLSGFLVGGSVLRAFERNRWSWKQYLTHRLVRLWIVLIPALLLGAFWDHFTLHNILRNPAHSNSFILAKIFPNMLSSLNLPDFFANAVFLQNLQIPLSLHRIALLPNFGSNGALWSLANEFWYYLLFPLALLAVRKGTRLPHRILLAVAFLLVSVFVGKTVMLLFPIWLCGVVLIHLPTIKLPRIGHVLSAIAYAVVFLVCVSLGHSHSGLADLLLSIFTTAFLWTVLSDATTPAPLGIRSALPRAVARFSYTLYLVHMPLLYFIANYLVHGSVWAPSLSAFALAFTVWFAIAAYAWGVANLTEFHNDSVRQWVEARIGLA